MNSNDTFQILQIDASANGADALTRRLARQTVAQLLARHVKAEITLHDLSRGVPLLDGAWLDANLKPDQERTAKDRAALSRSDELIAELRSANAVVISAPLYNFSIPASLKAWIDQVARAGETFRYTEQGPVGLLVDRPVYLVMASGGVSFGSAVDFASSYLQHVLGFLGLHDVRFIGAEATNRDPIAAEQAARRQIAAAFDNAPGAVA